MLSVVAVVWPAMDDMESEEELGKSVMVLLVLVAFSVLVSVSVSVV